MPEIFGDNDDDDDRTAHDGAEKPLASVGLKDNMYISGRNTLCLVLSLQQICSRLNNIKHAAR